MNYRYLCVGVGILSFWSITGHAQITYASDVVIEGNLDVGTTLDKGNLTVVGEVGNAAAPGLRVSGDGGVIFQGSTGEGVVPSVPSGSCLLWSSKHGALRAGLSLSGNTDLNIGIGSIGIGEASIASGDYSAAFGMGSTAAGLGSLASGYISYSSGTGSVALGDNCISSEWGAFSAGISTRALGGAAVALGSNSQAAGTGTVAIGNWVMSTGTFAAAIGYEISALSAHSFVIGRFNKTEGDSLHWVDSDPLFVIGNGTGDSADEPELRARNAFVVRKNGDVEMSARVSMPRQGDILMGEFGHSE